MASQWWKFQCSVLIVVVAGLAFGLTGQLARQEEPGEQTETPHPAPPKPLRIPAADSALKNPVPKVPEAIESGCGLFSSQCVMCHGEKGDGRGELAKTLSFKMPDLTDRELQEKRTDGDLFFLISHDHGQMPGESRLCAQNRWEMVHYIRTLQRNVARR